MKTKLYAALTIGLLLAGTMSLFTAYAGQKKSATPEPQCKISPVEAIKIAKGRVAGRVLQANFEFDEGKWVYGVMIVSGKTIKEVAIDPMTGKVGDVETVTPDGEAKEMRDALTKAIGGKVATKTGAKEKEDKD